MKTERIKKYEKLQRPLQENINTSLAIHLSNPCMRQMSQKSNTFAISMLQRNYRQLPYLALQAKSKRVAKAPLLRRSERSVTFDFARQRNEKLIWNARRA